MDLSAYQTSVAETVERFGCGFVDQGPFLAVVRGVVSGDAGYPQHGRRRNVADSVPRIWTNL
jgi:hypothetical protein